MFLDKTDDIVVSINRRLETAETVGCDEKLISMNTLAVAVQTYIRRVAQAIPPVERIACIYQHILNAQALFEIVISKLFHIMVSNFHPPTWFPLYSKWTHCRNLHT